LTGRSEKCSPADLQSAGFWRYGRPQAFLWLPVLIVPQILDGGLC
jgi:hypothetical protein